MHSTIAAIATARGSSGISIIKISGDASLDVAKKIFHNSFSKKVFKHRVMRHGFIIDPEKKRIIDEVMILYMQAPRSYTGEDVIEIHTHGGFNAANSVLKIVLSFDGLRLAEPGEFTKRAFLNGRIDLTQAEAVIDIINAKTEKALFIASSQSAGNLKNIINKIYNELTDILAEIEAEIDFSDDTDLDRLKIAFKIDSIIKTEVCYLINSYENFHCYREGIKIAIAGKPNVGKSSILNRFVCEEKAIVTDISGTTRDLIDVPLNMEGIPIIITDTAGIRDSEDILENIGINKTKNYLSVCDIIIFVIDASFFSEEDITIYNNIKSKKHIIAINKIDLYGHIDNISKKFKNTRHIVKTSALYNKGIEELKEAVIKEAAPDDSLLENKDEVLTPNIRQIKELNDALSVLQKASIGLKENGFIETVAIDLKEAIDHIGRIIGINAYDDILDKIFSRFCIGK